MTHAELDALAGRLETYVRACEVTSNGGSQHCADVRAAARVVRAMAGAHEILFAYGDQNEITDHPWWAIVRNGSFGRMVVLEGPFFSRERAEQLLEARRYEYKASAYVFCFSGHRSQHYKDLRAAIRSAIEAAKEAGHES